MLQRGVFSLGREVSRALRVKDGPLQTHRVPGGEVGTEPCCPASASCPGWLQALGAPHMSAPHFLSGRALQSENPVHWPGALTWDSAVLWPCRNFSRVSHLFIQSYFSTEFWGCFPRWCSVKESTCQCRRPGFHPWVGKIPWRRKWQLNSSILA